MTETWCTDNEILTNSNFHLKNYNIVPLERKTKKRGGGILIYIRNDLIYKKRMDLSVSDGDKEALTIELINKEIH